MNDAQRMLKMMQEKNQHRIDLMSKTDLTLEEMADLHDLPRHEFVRLQGHREYVTMDFYIESMPHHVEYSLVAGERPSYHRTEYKVG